MRKTHSLPEKPRKYYQFMIRQSYKQHVNEQDENRIKEIIARSYEDAKWILKKVGLFYSHIVSYIFIYFSSFSTWVRHKNE